MNRTFFTADLHLGHNRIIQYCNRPFKDWEEMEEEMLERFNSRLTAGDSLYILGDLCWSSYPFQPYKNLPNGKQNFFDRLNCKQLFLIKGNHDNRKNSEYQTRFAWVGDYKTLSFHEGKTQVVLSHYPFRTWVGKGRGAYHLYGHVHNRLPGEGRSLDVGVDAQGFYPISLEEVVGSLEEKAFKKDEP